MSKAKYASTILSRSYFQLFRYYGLAALFLFIAGCVPTVYFPKALRSGGPYVMLNEDKDAKFRYGLTSDLPSNKRGKKRNFRTTTRMNLHFIMDPTEAASVRITSWELTNPSGVTWNLAEEVTYGGLRDIASMSTLDVWASRIPDFKEGEYISELEFEFCYEQSCDIYRSIDQLELILEGAPAF